ncbi:MAG TPA: chorismate mutase, partial [Pseudomonadales bacterium]|nr:chorismate mutase [Pseudomonadales bacterium]
MTITLQQLREKIDSLDAKIQEMISERARCAQQVAEVKKAEDPDVVFYRAEREAQVLRNVMARNTG